MRHAVYAEADTLALADQVLTLNNALRDAERQRDAVQAALLEAMRVVAKVDPRGAAKWLRELGLKGLTLELNGHQRQAQLNPEHAAATCRWGSDSSD